MNKKILIGLGFGLGTLGIALSTIQLGLISYSIQKSKEKLQLKAFDEKIYIYALISTYMSNDAKKYFKENIEPFLGYKLINNQLSLHAALH